MVKKQNKITRQSFDLVQPDSNQQHNALLGRGEGAKKRDGTLCMKKGGEMENGIRCIACRDGA